MKRKKKREWFHGSKLLAHVYVCVYARTYTRTSREASAWNRWNRAEYPVISMD